MPQTCTFHPMLLNGRWRNEKKMWKHSLMYVIMMMEEDGKKNLQLSIILGTVIWSKRNNQKHDNVASKDVLLL